MIHGRGAVAMGVVAILLASSAAARPKPRRRVAGGSRALPTSPEKAAAAKLLNEGNEAFGSGDYGRAVERFGAAYDRFPSPKILFNLAEAYLALQQPGQAAEMFDRFVDSAGADLAPDRLLRARQRLSELQDRVGQLRVGVVPERARIELDGTAVAADRLAKRLFVDPGAHRLTAHREGEPPIQRQLNVEAGKVVTVDLSPGQPIAAPAPSSPPVPGPSITLTVPVPPPVPRRSIVRSPAFIAGVTTTVALAAGLVGTGSATLAFHQRYEDPARSPASRDFARRTGEGLAWASEGFLIAAAVSAAVTTAIVVTLYRRDKRAAHATTASYLGQVAF